MIGWSSCCICCVLSCMRLGPRAMCVCTNSVHVPCVCVCVHFASSCDQEFTTLIFLAGGQRGCRGAPSNEALPCNPGKRTCITCAWAPLWAAGGALTFVLLSSHFVLRHSFVSDVARGRNLTLDGSSDFVLHASLDVWHAWHKTSIS